MFLLSRSNASMLMARATCFVSPNDHFCLPSWARDLKYHLPFPDDRVEPHPYRLFHCIWNVSYLFGSASADFSLQFETLLESPEHQIRRLIVATETEDYGYDRNALTALVTPVPVGRWHEYADDSWFRAHESASEAVLKEILPKPFHE